ncbi:MAG TPA: S1/P1 Nuclease [Caulobacteraceae bacterium]|nr:S1/P1 Nuclease [Caulobacteraceae bacterium]
MPRRLSFAVAAATLSSLAWSGQALAWGSTGHRLVAQAAIESLPANAPAFMRDPAFAAAAAEMARDPDRTRAAGRAHDRDADAAHFVDGDDQGLVLGGPALGALPPTREEYDTALRAVGSDSWKAGYLPYAIIDGWQHLVKDLALWRADAAGARLTADPAKAAWLAADRARRELQIRQDVGVWAHFVGDAAYPLHVSIHYNGWGKGPNPDGYTTQSIHIPLEGPYVAAHVTLAGVKAAMTPYRDCRCAIESETGRYLTADAAQVVPIYALEKAGGFKDGDARGPVYMTGRIAAAASEMRDMIEQAWNASASMSVGYPTALPASDFEAGKVADPYLLLHSND